MKEFAIDIQLRWSDLDPNFHVRHSIYYDWGAQCRVEFLEKNGMTTDLMQQLHIGPILFREECIFKREIRSGDAINVDVKLLKSKRDFSRWSLQHVIRKNKDIIAAVVTVDCAWIDTGLRKLAAAPNEAVKLFSHLMKTDNFEWVE